MGWYNTAQVCLNGHIITAYADSYEQHRKDFCSECGQPWPRIFSVPRGLLMQALLAPCL